MDNYRTSLERAARIKRRVNVTDYLTVAQLFLKDNIFLERKLEFSDVKPRLLGHFGSCHGINLIYAILRDTFFENFSFILGPGHGFPALNANLFIDGKLKEKDVFRFCRDFSWPEGFPSHASPLTPGVITEGGELGYAFSAGYGQILGHPEKTVAVLLGDGEMETATAMASLNLNAIIAQGGNNGRILPILHLNEYKISGPTVFGRKSERELNQLIRGFGFTPVMLTEEIEEDIEKLKDLPDVPFLILKTRKGEGGPEEVDGKKVVGNYLSHQIPLPLAGSDEGQLRQLEEWLKSYKVAEIFASRRKND